MIVLVATKNIDKFNITKGIFQKLGLINYKYKNLRDYKLLEENEEVGTLKERAKDKVEFALKMLEKKVEYAEIAIIIGIDDGFCIPSKNLLTANSKELVDDILSGKMLNVGDSIEEVRSYAIYNKSKGKYYYYESRLPLIFLGNEQGIIRKEGINPLKNVLSFVFESLPVGNHSQDEIDEVVLGYVREDLKILIQKLKNRIT